MGVVCSEVMPTWCTSAVLQALQLLLKLPVLFCQPLARRCTLRLSFSLLCARLSLWGASFRAQWDRLLLTVCTAVLLQSWF